MERIHLALASRNGPERQNGILTGGKDRRPGIRFNRRVNMCAILAGAAALSLMSSHTLGQTTRTSPSAASTSKTIPSSASTSPNSPCNPSNPTSPCYSANAPRNPCYSAAAPNEPCSNTTTPNPRPSPTPSPRAAPAAEAAFRAFTADQAKSQIEAKGYSSVSGLRKDAKGIWRGQAEKDGLPVTVTVEVNGDVAAN